MDERVLGFKVSRLLKVVIVLVAMGLASLILVSIPPSPHFSVFFAAAALHHHNHSSSSSSSSSSKRDLDIGFAVTNFARDRMVYDHIIVSAFHGQDCLATIATLTPFEQEGGELTAVWFRFWNVTLPPVVLHDMSFENVSYVTIELRAKAMYGGKREIAMQVMCDDVKVVLVSSSNATWFPTLHHDNGDRLRKCEVDGIWRHREQWLFVAVFVVPVLLFMLALYCENFMFRRNCDDSMSRDS